MKGQLNVSTPSEYLARVDDSRKADIAALDAMIRKAAPKLESFVQIGILAYGRCMYKYPDGRERDWFRIGVASNASYISLYLHAGEGHAFSASNYTKQFPKAKISGGCFRFKRLSDLDPAAFKKLLGDFLKKRAAAS